MLQAPELAGGEESCPASDANGSLPNGPHSQIPEFPSFVPLHLAHRASVQSFVSGFAPYSDFNFASLICYDTQNSIRIAFLNGNLVVRFRDYLTGEPFYSFLGRNRIPETVDQLIGLSDGEGLEPELRLIPASVVAAEADLLGNRFVAKEDADSFDYILSVERLVTPDGSLRSKRKRIEKLKRSHPGLRFELLRLNDPFHAELVRGLCKSWQTKKSRTDEEFETECIAISRAIIFAKELELICLGAFLDSSMVGFTVNELVHDGFYMAHFGKADPGLIGCADYLECETAGIMSALGCTQMNFQQDLGLPGLRASKTAWQPGSYLKKSRVRRHG